MHCQYQKLDEFLLYVFDFGKQLIHADLKNSKKLQPIYHTLLYLTNDNDPAHCFLLENDHVHLPILKYILPFVIEYKKYFLMGQ